MSKLLQEISDVSNVGNISLVKFGLLNPDLLKKASVVEVVVPDTYIGTEPKENGLFDQRMGVIERGRICPTDEYDSTITPGYFGHIELAQPVFWIQHVDTIVKLLRCVCIRCSNLLIDKSDPNIMKEIKKRSGANRFKFISDLCSKTSNKRCIYNCGCNAIQPYTFRKLMADKIKPSPPSNIVQIEAEYKAESFKDPTDKKLKYEIDPLWVHNILKKITDTDIEILGYNKEYSRPEWMICTVLPVAPPAVRPSVRQDNNQRAEDDLTAKYCDIVKTNKLLSRAIEKDSESKTINALYGLLQYHVATLVDNEIHQSVPQAAHRSGRPLKVIRQRLKGKEGRIRTNIMGKRADFSARTVIDVDPNISIDQYGVPERIAMNLTIPERVTKYNMNTMYKYVRNGPFVHPGARQITKMNFDENGRPHPESISLKYVDRSSIVLEEGDLVERHLVDGDVALFNRQPTLHRMSMMGHKIKVMKGLTFRLNVYVCKPYNADFDGDEMNMHVPQHIETAYELEHITLVPTQIISPASCKPIIYVVQDTLVGSYLLTQPSIRLSRSEMYNLAMSLPNYTGVLPQIGEDGKWSGQDLYSMFLPDISLIMNNNSYDDNPVDKNRVVIKNGNYKSGVMDSKFLQNILIHIIFNTYGANAAKDFLDQNQRVITRWLQAHGFSLGVGDAVPKLEVSKKVEEIIVDKIKEVNTMIKQANQGTYQPNLDQKFVFKSLENDIIFLLTDAKNKAYKEIKKSIPEDNRFNICVNSGAKGSAKNIGQIMGVLGQQEIEGKRVPFGFTNRTLPHYGRDDYSAESRGFVKNSFISGLEPIEFFFHQMGGRTGNIDTAIKTAESGYIQRRLIKAMEDISIKYGGTVRNAANNIVEFTYGDDSIDPIKLEKIKLELLTYSNEQLEKKYKFTEEDYKNLKKIMDKKAYDNMNKDKNFQKDLDRNYEMIYEFREVLRNEYFQGMKVMDITVHCPINFHGLLQSARDKFHVNNMMKTDLTPKYIETQIDKLLKELKEYVPDNALKLFTIIMYSNLAPKVSIVQNRFNTVVFDYIINSIREKYLSSFVQPGEMVGILAAQSIGEPSTQMSTIGTEKIIIYEKNKANNTVQVYKGEIGTYINKIIEENPGYTFDTGYEDSVETILDRMENEIYIAGVGENEKTYLNKISHVSRHPANGEMVKIKTRSGREVTTTLSHSHLVRTQNSIIPARADALKLGMRIPVARSIKYNLPTTTSINIGNKNIQLTELFGWFIGAYLAEGCLSNYTIKITSIQEIYQNNVSKIAVIFGSKANIRKYQGQYGPGVDTSFSNKHLAEFIESNCGNGSYVKRVPSFVYTAPEEFIKGLLRGYFDGDGNINCDRNHHTIRACSRSKDLVRDLGILYSYMGIAVNYSSEVKKGVNLYHYTVPYKYAKIYKDKIGTDSPKKLEALDGLVKYMERDDIHDKAEYVDKIPMLGNLIAECGKKLNLPGQSRNYGRWKKKSSIGRGTLGRYIDIFKKNDKDNVASEEISILEQAFNGDVIWDEIVELTYMQDPEEYVYDFTVPKNQTFMLLDGIIVHNTLNSVEWNTEVMIKKDNEIKRVKIGEWIDNKIESTDKSKIENHPNDTTLAYTENEIEILACTEDGKIIWDTVEAVTKHPPVNKDGSNTLIKVTTHSGREVVATKAKSFLKRVNNKIVPINGDQLNVGDYVPVSKIAPLDMNNHKWKVAEYLDKSEWLYMSEVEKALQIYKSELDNNNRHWWKKNSDKFTVPYKRSDSFLDAFGPNKIKKLDKNLIENCIYPVTASGCSGNIKEEIELDKEFGFIVGAYLAEGHCTKYQLLISNIDKKYNEKIIGFCNKFKLNYHIDEKTVNNGLSKTIRIHSYVLAQLFGRSIGNTSKVKRIPIELINSNMEFLKGLLDGYYSGDGFIPIKDQAIHVTSVSKKLLDDVQQVLSVFGIVSNIAAQESQYKYSQMKKMNSTMPYMLSIRGDNITKFKMNVDLTIDYKAERLAKKNPTNKFYKKDTLPNIMTKQWGEITIKRSELAKYMKKSTNLEDQEVFRNIQNEDIFYDKIVKIEEVQSEFSHVYDLTVKNTRNFNIYNGLAMHDTFHHAGVGANSVVTTTGVPRLREIINVAKTIRTPSLTIYLKDEYSKDMGKAKTIMSQLEYTKLQDIVAKTQIIYESDSGEISNMEDIEFITTYQEFASLVGYNQCPDEVLSKWVLRLVFDKEAMMNKNIYLSDIQDILMKNNIEDDIQCIFTDDNAGELVLRVRIKEDQVEGDYLNFLQELEKVLMSITIRGIPNIEKVEMSLYKKLDYMSDGTYNQGDEWTLQTIGVNLMDALLNDYVDETRTYSNDINEINDIFGIEATREILIS